MLFFFGYTESPVAWMLISVNPQFMGEYFADSVCDLYSKL
jgi:hypothetical protein